MMAAFLKQKAKEHSFESLVFFALSFNFATAQYNYDHLTVSCNGERSTSIGGRLESSTKLTYENNMDCTFKVTAPAAKRINVDFNYFKTEEILGSVCLDYLNIHDGGNTTAPPLNTNALCGSQPSLPDYTTSGQQVTFHFVTDETAVDRGFDLVYTVFSMAPCGESDFACNNSMCVDESLKCDGHAHCTDGSDEDTLLCTVESNTASAISMGLIVGSSAAGLVGLLILIFAIYKLVDYYKWKKWLKMHDLHENPWDEQPYQYPVTENYHSRLPILTSARIGPAATPRPPSSTSVMANDKPERKMTSAEGSKSQSAAENGSDVKSDASVDSTYKTHVVDGVRLVEPVPTTSSSEV